MRPADWTSDDGTIQLYHGDCLELLPQLPAGSVDAVVTDPPYGIDHKSHGHWFRKAVPIAGDQDNGIFMSVHDYAISGGLALMAFYSPYSTPAIKWRSILVWAKGEHVGIGGDRATCWKRDFELVGVKGNKPLNGPRDSSVLRFNAVLPPPSGHFCEKPVALMQYLVGKLQERAMLDPFLGSGTTAVACMRTGRRCIGIEIEKKYFDIAVERCDAEQKRFPLIEREAEPKQIPLWEQTE